MFYHSSIDRSSQTCNIATVRLKWRRGLVNAHHVSALVELDERY